MTICGWTLLNETLKIYLWRQRPKVKIDWWTSKGNLGFVKVLSQLEVCHSNDYVSMTFSLLLYFHDFPGQHFFPWFFRIVVSLIPVKYILFVQIKSSVVSSMPKWQRLHNSFFNQPGLSWNYSSHLSLTHGTRNCSLQVKTVYRIIPCTRQLHLWKIKDEIKDHCVWRNRWHRTFSG